ncbi:hypothetical protein MNBD_GAMMA20-2524 [hydrothermal vent metagenome]|uniref:Beta-propeller repeat protein n=1 Tax=hydrothermal vent metagenome TaxID=652676 RepID=A0A3B0ZTA0_9ZZZZ
MCNIKWILLLLFLLIMTSLPVLVSAETVFKEISVTYDEGKKDYIGSATVDIDGNMYFTGSSPGNTYLTVKYDSYGREKWVRTYSPNPASRAGGAGKMTVDRAGNIYVAPSRNLGKILKYDADGNQSILSNPRIVPYGCCSKQTGLVLDKNENNLYSWASHTIQKISLDGGSNWLQRFHTANYLVRGIATDDSGNIYVVGHSVAVNNPSAGGLIIKKFDNLGNVIWSRFWHAEGDGSQGETVHGLQLDTNNNIYLLVQSINYENSCLYCITSFVVRFSSDGSTTNSTILNGTNGYQAGAIKVADDKIYVTMLSRNTHILTVQKLNTDLSLDWSTEYSHSNGNLSLASPDVDGLGNVLVGFRQQYNDVIIKFDVYGNELWTQNFDGRRLVFLKFGTTGEIYAAGSRSTGFGANHNADVVMYRYGVTQLICQ